MIEAAKRGATALGVEYNPDMVALAERNAKNAGVSGKATFVRLLDRPEGDSAKATATVNRLVDLLTGWPQLNEFKYTQLPQ